MERPAVFRINNAHSRARPQFPGRGGRNEAGLLIDGFALKAQIRCRHIGGAVGQQTQARHFFELPAFGDPGLDGLNCTVAGADEDIGDAILGKACEARHQICE